MAFDLIFLGDADVPGYAIGAHIRGQPAAVEGTFCRLRGPRGKLLSGSVASTVMSRSNLPSLPEHLPSRY